MDIQEQIDAEIDRQIEQIQLEKTGKKVQILGDDIIEDLKREQAELNQILADWNKEENIFSYFTKEKYLYE